MMHVVLQCSAFIRTPDLRTPCIGEHLFPQQNYFPSNSVRYKNTTLEIIIIIRVLFGSGIDSYGFLSLSYIWGLHEYIVAHCVATYPVFRLLMKVIGWCPWLLFPSIFLIILVVLSLLFYIHIPRIVFVASFCFNEWCFYNWSYNTLPQSLLF